MKENKFKEAVKKDKMKEILHSTKFLNLVAQKREGKADWVYAHRPNVKNVVVIVPLIHKKDGVYTLFLTTKRPPVTEEYGDVTCLEFPAGLVGDEAEDETTLEALKKELLEETGYSAESFKIKVKNMTSSGGMTSEKSTLAVAEIFDTEKKAEPVDDGGVITGRVEVKIEDTAKFIDDMEKNGMYISAQTLAGLYFLGKEE